MCIGTKMVGSENINISPMKSDDYTNMSFGQLKYSDNVYEEFVQNPLDSIDNTCEQNYCRLCGHSVSVSCLSSFNTKRDGISFLDKIKFCFGEKVTIHTNDGLPQEICDSCIVNVNTFNRVLVSYIKADEELRKLFMENKTEVIDDITKINTINIRRTELMSSATETVQNMFSKPKNIQDPSLCLTLTVSKPIHTYSRKEPNRLTAVPVTAKTGVNLDSIKWKPESFEIPYSLNSAPPPLQIPFFMASTESAQNVITINNECWDKSDTNEYEIVETRYECLICNSQFESKEKLVQHYIAEHPIPPGKKILCKVTEIHRNVTVKKPEVVVPKIVNQVEKCVSADKVYYGISYQCIVCSLVFQRKSAFLKHSLQRHQTVGKNRFQCKIVRTKITKNGKLSCTECNSFFSNYKLYRQHMRKHGLYKCDDCDMTFDKLQNLRLHSKTHKPCDTFFCSLCPKVFASRKDLIAHGAEHYKDKVPDANVYNEYFKAGKYRCTTCFEIFDSAISVRKHQRVHESCLCNQCGKLFSSLNYLQRHIKTHTDARPFSCNVCLKSFKTMPSLNKHRRTHDNERNFICQHCGKLFRTLQVLRQHVLTHTTLKPHACDICGVAFRRRSNMVVHRNRHASLEFSSEQCKECGRKFSSLKALRCHLVQHMRPGAPFECNVCKKRFLTQRQCEMHERGHSDERPYPCDVCQKSFRSAATLRQHKVIHENVFPHECNFCDRKFRRLQSLLVHKKTHTGERPHDCPECGRAFANRGDMIKHRRIHMRSHASTTSLNISNTYIEPSVVETTISEPADMHLSLPIL